MSKDNRVNLRFDDTEILAIREKAGDIPIARFCRDVVLGTRVRRKKRITKYDNYPPEVVRQLSAIGNNLNQITRLGHLARKDNALDLIQLVDAVEIIKQQIDELACPDVS